MGEVTESVHGVSGLSQLVHGHLELNRVAGINDVLVILGTEATINNTVH